MGFKTERDRLTFELMVRTLCAIFAADHALAAGDRISYLAYKEEEGATSSALTLALQDDNK